MNLVFEKLTQFLSAGQVWRLTIAADFFRIAAASWPVKVRIMKAGRILGEMDGWQAGDFVRDVDFDAVEIEAGTAAQNVTVQIAGGGVGSDRVIGEVSVIDGGKSRVVSEKSFISHRQVPAATGMYSRLQLLNPIGSGVRVIVNQVWIQAESAAGFFAIRTYNTPEQNLSQASRVSKNNGDAYQGAHELRWGQQATDPGTSWGGRVYSSNTMPGVMMKWSEPLVLGEGKAVMVASTWANIEFSAAFEGYEEDA